MTTRLVCLMSLLLLAALAVFGLLVRHSQDRIMKELERTVSTVGRGTLQSLGAVRSLERSEPRGGEARAAGGSQRSTFTLMHLREEEGPLDPKALERLEMAWEEAAPGRPLPGFLVRARERCRSESAADPDASSAPTSEEDLAAVGGGPTQAPQPRPSPTGDSEGATKVVRVWLSDVRVQSGSRQHLLLRIPTQEMSTHSVKRSSGDEGESPVSVAAEPRSIILRERFDPEPDAAPTGGRTGEEDGPSGESWAANVSYVLDLDTGPPLVAGWSTGDGPTGDRPGRAPGAMTFEPVFGGPTGAGIFRPESSRAKDIPGEARTAEILLGVPVATYEDIFARMRQQSLLIFLGVLGVGVLLAILLAKRFLKPVRELDTALARLSEGDWSASVGVRGRDEMARLGQAFNRMTSRVRESRQRELEMRRREKLSALGRLAAGVAHDVRNPLHSVNLTLQHLEDVCRPSEEEVRQDFDRTLGLMRGEIRRLDGLIENFLRFARSEPGRRQRVKPEMPLREVAQLLEKEAQRRGVRLETRIAGELPELEVELEGLRSAILNLVLNGFDAMPGGGTVSLAVRREGREVVFDVVDTGQGIPESELDRIFDFGYSTRETGTGLGLTMVHHVVVEEHGGRIQVESTVGSGSRFRLRLPLGRGRSKREVA